MMKPIGVQLMRYGLLTVRISLIVFAVSFLCASLAFSQQIQVSPNAWDAGNVTVGNTVSRQFTLSNTGATTATVSSYAFGPNTSSAFAVISGPSTPLVLDAGMSVVVEVSFTPTRAATQLGSLEALSDTGNASASFFGSGRIQGLSTIPSIVDFGSTSVGTSALLTATLTNNSAANVMVNAVRLTSGDSAAFSLAGSPISATALPPGAMLEVQVSYSPSLVASESATLEFSTSGGTLQILVQGRAVSGQVEIDPATLSFGNVLLGNPAVRSVLIRNPGATSLLVNSFAFAAGSNAAFSVMNPPAVPFSLAPSASQSIDVQYNPSTVGGGTGVLQITTNNSTQPTALVNVRGNGVTATFWIHPTDVDFGNTLVGSPAIRSIAIHNSGASDLTVTSLTASSGSSPDFAIVSPTVSPFTIASGRLQQVQIRYAPATAGQDTGTLEITTNAGVGRIGLAGNGIFGLGFQGDLNRIVGSGLQCPVCIRVTLLNGVTAPAGGLQVALTTSNAGRMLLAPSTIPTNGGSTSILIRIPGGTNGESFSVQGLESVTGSAFIIATAAGAETATSAPINVVRPTYRLMNLSMSYAGGGPDVIFKVRIGAGGTSGTSFFPQQVRNGGPGGVTATVGSSNGTAAQLVTSTGTASVRTVAIPIGQLETESTVASGGIAFRPMSPGGITTVTASIAGYTALPQANQSVTVTSTAPSLTVNFGALTRLGAGLEVIDCCTVTSSQPAPSSGLEITLTSGDANRLLVAPVAIPATGGSGVLTLTIPAGSSSVSFSLQGVEGATGNVSIMAAATGYTSGTSPPVSLETPVLTLIGLNESQSNTGPNDDFQVRLGLPTTPGGTIFGAARALRRGGPGAVTATITTSNPGAGLLVSSSGSDINRTVQIQPGQTDSPATVANGGIAFDPNNSVTASQTTTVAATVPGFIATTGASQTITVSGAVFELAVSLDGSTRLGAGLELAACCMVTSSQPAPAGGLEITLTSNSPARVLVAPGVIPSAGGSGAVTLVIPAGGTSATFSLQGVEGASGNATVTATAIGYTSGTSLAVTLETPVLTLIGLNGSQSNTGPNDDFQVRLGLPTTPGGTTFGITQALRQGGPGAVTATITTSNPGAGLLVNSNGSDFNRTVQIQPGQSDSPATVAVGGIAFDPTNTITSTQVTTVSVVAPGFNAVSGASQNVTVALGLAFEFVFPGGEFRVGAGLTCGACRMIRLLNGAVAPAGGLTITLTSDNPAVLVSPSTWNAVGSNTAIITMPAGAWYTTSFSIHGLENSQGATGRITATAPGVAPATSPPIRVVQPAVNLHTIASPQNATGPDSIFMAMIGVTAEGGGPLISSQSLRRSPDLPPGIILTLTSSNPGVGQLVTRHARGPTVEVLLTQGHLITETELSFGGLMGVAFDPVAPGTTNITVSTPGFLPAANATRAVTVVP